MPNLSGFDAREHEERRSLDAIPKGDYLAVITESEWKDTKAGTGQYLQLVFEVIDGDYKGRMLWVRLNLRNPNEVAVKIANSELAEICRAVGVNTPKDSAELHGVPLMISVVAKPRKDTGELSNEVKKYKPAKEASAPAPAKSASAEEKSGDKPPWA